MDFHDNYEHTLAELIYFPKSIPTKELELEHELNLPGCKCELDCKPNDCACLERSGTSYRYDNISDLLTYIIIEGDSGKPTYECNSNCRCLEACGNKLTQYGPNPNLYVKDCSNNKGLGLFALADIKKDSFVCEYAGELINEEEARKRFEHYKTRLKMNYIFCINEYFGMKNVKTFIDPTYYGNIGRYINHSCEPNCKLIIVRTDSTLPCLCIFANKDIAEGSELSFDYGDMIQADTNNKTPCLCDSENCRLYLPFDSTITYC